ncbi:MAG: phosphonoacetaldehyde hydrolase [Actinomycetia bacterium]|nr:phosphonoacetaldehyde hydrolase [Actinomycetes bacterium]
MTHQDEVVHNEEESRSARKHPRIHTVILDWAGTTIDYGCFAPVDAFIEAFEHFGITPTIEETRAPMGMEKKDHIRKMLDGDRLMTLWKETRGDMFTEQDVDDIYKRFEPALLSVLLSHCQLLPDVLETVKELRNRSIAIGSTTGYSHEMMALVAPAAAALGYSPDCLVCPEDVGTGRPAPNMIWLNIELLKTPSVLHVLKVGDTAADMQEGKFAGCLSAGVLRGSSMVGLSEDECDELDTTRREAIFDEAKQNYYKAGADFVIERFSDLPELIDTIETTDRNMFGEVIHV